MDQSNPNDILPAWLKLQQQGQPPTQQMMSPLSMSQPAAPSSLAMPQIPAPAKRAPAQRTNTKTTSYETADPGDIQSAAETYRNLPEVQSQASDLDQLKDLINRNAQMQTGNAGWIKPLLAYADSQTGSKLSQGYAGQTQSQQNDDLIKQLGEVQKRKQDLSKDVLTGMNSALHNKMGQTVVQVGDPTGNGSGKQDPNFARVQGLLTQMRGDQAAQQAERDLYATKKVNSLANLYGDPNKLSQTQVDLLKDEVGKIASGGQATMSGLEELSNNTVRGKLSKISAALLNSPTPANAAEFVKQYKDYANTVAEDGRNLLTSRASRVLEPNRGKLSADDYSALNDSYVDRFKNFKNDLQPAATGAGTGPGGHMSFDEWKASQKGK